MQLGLTRQDSRFQDESETVARQSGLRKLAHKLSSAHIRPWLIPGLYAFGAIATRFTIPRTTSIFLPQFVPPMSVGAAIGFYSVIACGMIALTSKERSRWTDQRALND